MIVGEELILKYLNDDCKKSERDLVKSWMKEDASNATEMKRLQRVWSELNGVNSFMMPAMDEEWSKMNALISLNGATDVIKNTSVPEPAVVQPKPAVLAPKPLTVPPKPIAAAVSNTSAGVTKVKAPTPTYQKLPHTSPSVKKASRSDIPTLDKVIYGIGSLLVLGILIFGIIALFKNKNQYLEMESKDKIENIALYDGSEVQLQPFSKLVYPRSSKKTQRIMTLSGSAIFDIMAAAEPFIIDYGEVSVKTLGTEFEVVDNKEFVTAECTSGKIRFYQTANEENGVQINEGEKYKYKDGIFENMTIREEVIKEDVVVNNGSDVRLDVLLDWLMEESKWKVISTPSMPFDRDYVVNVNLDQHFEDVLAELSDEIDLVYESANCDGCYVIKRMKAL